MQGVKTKSGLPQPYNMKPKGKGFLTTPMKKLLAYMVLLFTFGWIIYEISPKPQKFDTEYELAKEGEAIKKADIAADRAPNQDAGHVNHAEVHDIKHNIIEN